MTTLAKNVRALYWNGEEFETSVFPGAAVVADEYQAFARSLLRCLEGASNPLVVELGSGTGMVQFHVRQVAAETGQQVKFIGFEFNPYALLFSELIAERFGISIVNNMVDLAASIQDVGHLEEIRRRIHEAAEGRPIYVMTHGGLHPFFDDNFYCRLFPFLIDQVGVVGGVHEELIGFRTPAFSRLRAAVSEAPSIKSPFVDNRANPLGYLEENADKLDISMTRRIEIVAHFPNRHFPSFLSWERRGRPPGQHQ